LFLVLSAVGTGGLLLVAPSASPDRTVVLLLLSVGGLGALIAVERAAPRLDQWVVLATSAVLLTLACARPPHGSSDVWSYAMYGRIVAHYHRSPYAVRAAAFPSDPILLRVAPGWRHARSVYGPAFTGLSAAIMATFGSAATGARVAFQLVAAAAVLGSCLLLARAGVSRTALLVIALDPLLIVAVVNGGHNDALVGLGLVAAVLSLRDDRIPAAGVRC
jgi:hypothetical protein